ncbi:hypothetical protein U1Q18_004053 [Sarracenia purpurea var. burkii]
MNLLDFSPRSPPRCAPEITGDRCACHRLPGLAQAAGRRCLGFFFSQNAEKLPLLTGITLAISDQNQKQPRLRRRRSTSSGPAGFPPSAISVGLGTDFAE